MKECPYKGSIHNAMVKEPICKKDSSATLLKAGGIRNRLNTKYRHKSAWL